MIFLNRKSPKLPVMDEFIRHLSKLKPVTICIAAICDVGYVDQKVYPKIILCADRFVSSLVQQEGAVVKIKKFTPYCLVMSSSNDSETSDMILERAMAKLRSLPEEEKLTLAQIVSIVRQECVSYKEERVSTEVLSKYNLLSKQVGVEPKAMISEAIKEIGDYDYQLEFQFIILGFDSPTEPHIYTINQDGAYRPNDLLGYAQIGSGGLLAYLQMTKSKHSKTDPSVSTIPLVYFAKKLSERAQGVGRVTDFYAIFYSFQEPPPKDYQCTIINLGRPELIKLMDESLATIEDYENNILDTMSQTVRSVLTKPKDATDISNNS